MKNSTGNPKKAKPAPKIEAKAAPRPNKTEVDSCPIAATVAILGDRWSVLIMRDLLLGLRRFDELVKSLGIATNILTDRLNRLTDEGLIARQAYQKSPTRFEYLPTPAGEDFRRVIMSIGEWGKAWRMTPQGRTPFQYINCDTGNAIIVKLVDAKTGAEVPIQDAMGVTTDWADDLVNWRIATARAHAGSGNTGKA